MSEVGLDTAEDDYADPQVKALQQQGSPVTRFSKSTTTDTNAKCSAKHTVNDRPICR